MPTINLTDDQLETIDAALEFVDTQRLADRYLDMGEFEHEQVTAARIALRTSQPAHVVMSENAYNRKIAETFEAGLKAGREQPAMLEPDWSRVNPKYQWAWLTPMIDAKYGPKFCWRFRETEPIERHVDSNSFLGLEHDYISWFPIELPLGVDYRTTLRRRPPAE
jgi:hypothetical protein